MSRLDQLRLEVAAAQSAGDLQPKELDLAIYLLRSGKFRAATDIYSKFRHPDIFNSSQDMAIRVMVFEGLRSYFESQAYEFAVDRLNRALILSISLRQTAMVAMTGAWLAHLTFNSGKYDKMLWALGVASQALRREDLDSAIRISLTMADACCAVEDYEQSRDWYLRVRSMAVDFGDQISLAAMMHNRAVICISNFFFNKFVLKSESEESAVFLPEILSAENYEEYIGIQPMLYPYLMWKYRIDILKDSFQSALEIANDLLSKGDFSGIKSYARLVLIDCAYCYYKTNDIELARSLVSGLNGTDFDGIGFDDRAVSYAMMAKIYEACGDSKEHSEYQGLAADAAENHLSEQRRLRSCIDRLSTDADFLGCQLFR